MHSSKVSASVGRQKWALSALVLGGVAIGFSPIFVRLSEIGPITTGFWRLALALLPLLLWFGASHERSAQGVRPRRLSDHFAAALPGVFLAGDIMFWHISLTMTSVANATLLVNMTPIFVTLGSWIFFRRLPSRVFLIGLAASVAGVVILKGGPMAIGEGSLQGDLVALMSAALYGGYILLLGRLRSRFSTMIVMLWSTASAALVLLPLALIFEPRFVPLAAAGWLVLLALAWVSQVGGQGLIAFALAWLSPAFSALTLLIQPIVAAILAWVLLNEPLGPMQIVGGLIVLAGIWIARRG